MKRTSLACALILAAGFSLPALATSIDITLNLGKVATGTAPSGTAPWLKAEFVGDTTSNTGTLTLTSILNSTDFIKGQNGPNTMTGWSFSLSDLTGATCSGGKNCPDGIALGDHTYNQIGGGSTFNLIFGWKSGNTFGPGDTAIIDLTFGSDVASTGPFWAQPTYFSLAHIQGISPNGCSGWIVDGSGTPGVPQGDGKCNPPANVPEPANLGMFGLGTLLIGLYLGLRRRFS